MVNEKKNKRISDIAIKMTEAGYPISFLVDLVIIGNEYDGVYDLIELWDEETDYAEKEAIMVDIQDMLIDCKVCSNKEK